ncbi:Nucleic acid-binding protein [Glarea lozoyensis ATCC 20868]|uniref:Nucleic acid-binding protein n=1 Tax=Glarea lozoyensis (strain ATCC 20868 / MF5171) TaxID=1116229 RepID=S3DCF4_GLAL2|nr:Nucleic acid-binding protein [Glarea lozoyensis ATCC 20868]EPE24343.1 Nucleic acid-binding protein [Glarea lozoyensis ATCC 20868]
MASTFTPAEETEISQWITTSTRLSSASPAEQQPLLSALNTHLSSRTTVLGTKPSKADTALYESLRSIVSTWTAEQKTGENGHPNIVRHLDFVQNSSVFDITVKEEEKLKVDPDEILYVKPPVDAKAEKERLKKEKAAAAAAAGGETALPDRAKGKKEKGIVEKATEKVVEAKDAVVAAVAGGSEQPQGGRQKKEKKEKAPKPQKAPAATAPLSPSLIDLRVGHILKAIKHPEADSLFVSTIAMGDKPGTEDTSEHEGQVVRTVCSGLNGLVPLEEMQGRKVVVVCNLKPVKMRGVKSCAMVLAASPRLAPGVEDNHAGPVELVTPPEGSTAGERVYFEGWQGEPEGVLNPKRKVWDTIQPGFTTTEGMEVGFDASVVKELSKEGEEPKTGLGKLITQSGGVCTVKSLANAVVR